MTLGQALVYFTREACQSLVRSWKVSLVAVLTITMSLFLAGAFLLLSSNLHRVIDDWRRESKVLVYLVTGSDVEDRQRIARQLEGAPGIDGFEEVSAEEARERFERSFPSMADLLEGWGEEPLPASFEIRVDWQRVDRRQLDAWLAELRGDPAVSMVDDDRDWLRQLQAVVLVLRGLSLVLGAILLLTAIFTISSVIRLTAYLYRDEISVMRLVGATEFFIRGPFYLEGLLQGLAGGSLSVLALLGAHLLLVGQQGDSLIVGLLAGDFLSASQAALLVALGAFAGLVGAVSSLRKEDLGKASAPEDWPAD